MIRPCTDQERLTVLTYFSERFGLEETVFHDYALYAGSNGRILLGPKGIVDFSVAETAGILMARLHKAVKPTSLFFQVFGVHVTRNRIALTGDQTQNYLIGENVELTAEQIGHATRGYVLLTYMDSPLACGLLKDTRIENVLPKTSRLRIDHL